MMDKLIEQIKRDREAGTPGPWVAGAHHSPGIDRMVEHHVVNSHVNGAENWIGVHIQPRFAVEAHGKANAARIARVPEMEARIMSDADEITRLRAELAAARECIANLEESEERLETELAAAREQVAGAYMAAAKRVAQAGHSLSVEIEHMSPADAIAALEARDALVRAEEREKVIDVPLSGEEIDAIEKSVRRWHGEERRTISVRWEPYKKDGRRQMRANGRWQEMVGNGDFWRWVNCDRPTILHTDESRKAGGDA